MRDARFHKPGSWSPFDEEYVLGELLTWQQQGLKTALVTLVNIDGATPRALGAQMAVAEDGRFFGYLSGGCLERAVALEAASVIAQGANRLTRYGKGSAYLDIRLPCGSGLDLYFDQSLSRDVLERAALLRAGRRAFALEINCARACSGIALIEGVPSARRDGDVFRRGYAPPLRLLLLGSGPSMVALAHIAATTGFECLIASPSDDTRDEIGKLGLPCHALSDIVPLEAALLDPWTGAVLAFHEHDREAESLKALIESDCFYIGALGSKAAHAARISALARLGASEAAIARIKSPIGLIGGAKSRGLLASGIVSDVLAEAKSANLIW